MAVPKFHWTESRRVRQCRKQRERLSQQSPGALRTFLLNTRGADWTTADWIFGEYLHLFWFIIHSSLYLWTPPKTEHLSNWTLFVQSRIFVIGFLRKIPSQNWTPLNSEHEHHFSVPIGYFPSQNWTLSASKRLLNRSHRRSRTPWCLISTRLALIRASRPPVIRKRIKIPREQWAKSGGKAISQTANQPIGAGLWSPRGQSMD